MQVEVREKACGIALVLAFHVDVVLGVEGGWRVLACGWPGEQLIAYHGERCTDQRRHDACGADQPLRRELVRVGRPATRQ